MKPNRTPAISTHLCSRHRVRRVHNVTGLLPCRDMSRYQVYHGFSMHTIAEKSANCDKTFARRLAERPITHYVRRRFRGQSSCWFSSRPGPGSRANSQMRGNHSPLHLFGLTATANALGSGVCANAAPAATKAATTQPNRTSALLASVATSPPPDTGPRSLVDGPRTAIDPNPTSRAPRSATTPTPPGTFSTPPGRPPASGRRDPRPATRNRHDTRSADKHAVANARPTLHPR